MVIKEAYMVVCCSQPLHLILGGEGKGVELFSTQHQMRGKSDIF